MTKLMPILVTIQDAAHMVSRGQTWVYEAIGSGTLQAVKSNRRTLVTVASLMTYIDSLPPAKISPPRRRSTKQHVVA
jgi:hypothetical protein